MTPFPDRLAYEWRRCPTHGWAGVSILVVAGDPVACFLPDGTQHAVAA